MLALAQFARVLSFSSVSSFRDAYSLEWSMCLNSDRRGGVGVGQGALLEREVWTWKGTNEATGRAKDQSDGRKSSSDVRVTTVWIPIWILLLCPRVMILVPLGLTGG